MGKLYFSDRECRDAGFSTAMINTLRQIADFVDTQNEIAAAQADLAAAEAELTTQGNAIDDANTSITALNAAVNTLDGRIDAYDALAPFVRQDQTGAWVTPTGTLSRATFAAFAGQTITNPPTQAEVQAIDDHLVILSQRLAALITDLRTVNVLT